MTRILLLALFVTPCLILRDVQSSLYAQSKAKTPLRWTLGSSTSLIDELNPEILREVKESGIDLIEIGWRGLNWHDLPYDQRLTNARRAYSQAKDAGISIWSTHVPYGEDVDISNPDESHRRKAIARVKEFIDLALEMHAKHVVLHASERIAEHTREQRVLKCRESLKELSKYMDGKGIALAIESLPPDFMGNSSQEILRIIEGIDHVGICFDTNHLVPEKPDEFIRAVGNKITTVHIADFDGVEQKHWMPGRGAIEWSKLIDELIKSGYSGPFMYEVVRREGETHTFRDLKGNYDMLMREWQQTAPISPAQDKPVNIVLILADDLGYGDLQCYGAPDIKTPNIDRLAKEGVRFVNFYSNGPECTPTRAALLTGRYQQRVGGLECAIGLGNIGRYEEALQLSNREELGLPTRFNVLPKILKEKGYSTALIGKWHLGDGEKYRPAAHGFDYSIGPLGGAVDYFHHTEPKGVFLGTEMKGETDLLRNDQPHLRQGYYMTHLIADEAVEWINIQKADRPFFLYVPFTAPHDPFQGPDDYSPVKMEASVWNEGSRNDYVSLVEELDKGVGAILDKLEEKGFSKNTVVIFTSDNGPTKKGSAGNLSGNKGHVFEGGIRVPCILRWPGNISAGHTSEQVGITMDLTASIAAIVDAQSLTALDGIDIIGRAASGATDFPRTLFWRKKRGDNVIKAVRDGRMKYIVDSSSGKESEYLFDLADDPVEKKNLMKDRKEAKRLKALLRKWEEEVKPER